MPSTAPSHPSDSKASRLGAMPLYTELDHGFPQDPGPPKAETYEAPGVFLQGWVLNFEYL